MTQTLFATRRADIHEFVNDLIKAKVFTIKQCIVIENLYIYVKDSEVYKVIVAVNPNLMKKAKKLGIDVPYKTYFMEVKLKLDPAFITGSYIILYDVNTKSCNIFNGEVSEEEQMKRIIEKRKR